ncbi:MAG TPA: uroporphyrinogen-III C-methyltransferase, partial [Vampirovibrionales bacterium]
KKGFVWLVGAGPGNPELLTLKAVKCIEEADVILHDALANNVYKPFISTNCNLVYVGKRSGCHSTTQKEINEMLVAYAEEGKNVVRLKGGDPLIYARAAEEIKALKDNNIPFGIVPGISSFNAGCASVGFPATQREVARQVMLIDGHTCLREDADWSWVKSFQGMISIFMGKNNLQAIAKRLIKEGVSAEWQVVAVEDAGTSKASFNAKKLRDIALKGFTFQSEGPGIIYIAKHIENYLQKGLT